MHSYHVPPEHSFLVRMMAVREGVVGGLLITAGDPETEDKGRRCAHYPLGVSSTLIA